MEELEFELARLRSKLEEYQGLIDALPAIYEAKFRHQLRDVAQDIGRLMAERQALQEQINRGLAAPREPLPSPARPWWRRPPRWRLGLVAATSGLALAAVVALQWQSAPAPVQPPAEPLPAAPQPAVESELRLRASGEAWLEVQTLAGEVIYVNTLQAGQAVTIRFGQPLRIHSGRPDLLEFAVADQPFVALGSVYDLDGRTVRPPEAGGPSS